LDVVPLEQLGVVAARILHTAIGVVDQGAGHRLEEGNRGQTPICPRISPEVVGGLLIWRNR
jgi:hypothetical protein